MQKTDSLTEFPISPGLPLMAFRMTPGRPMVYLRT